jgi:hypothetical protein
MSKKSAPRATDICSSTISRKRTSRISDRRSPSRRYPLIYTQTHLCVRQVARIVCREARSSSVALLEVQGLLGVIHVVSAMSVLRPLLLRKRRNSGHANTSRSGHERRFCDVIGTSAIPPTAALKQTSREVRDGVMPRLPAFVIWRLNSFQEASL